MKKYIIGIDGGGTKTIGMVFDPSGQEIKRITAGYASFSVDEKNTLEHLFQALAELTSGIDASDIEIIQIGIAGYTNYENKQKFLDELHQRCQAPVSVVTDAELALYSVKKYSDLNVIMVLGGTGSVVMSEFGGKISFVGGFGHLLGDEGSGYHLAISALKEIIDQYESQREITKLSKAILMRIGASDYSKIKNFVYNNSKNKIAELAPLIAEAANNHDPDAIRLLVQEGKLLGIQAIKAYRVFHSETEVLLGFKGGFLLKAPHVKETLIEVMKEAGMNFKIDPQQLEPVYGAYYLAMTNKKRWQNG